MVLSDKYTDFVMAGIECLMIWWGMWFEFDPALPFTGKCTGRNWLTLRQRSLILNHKDASVHLFQVPSVDRIPLWESLEETKNSGRGLKQRLKKNPRES